MLVLFLLVAFPLLAQRLTEEPLTGGRPKFWQGLLIQAYVLAVYAISYDLLFGYAMFFGTDVYTTAML